MHVIIFKILDKAYGVDIHQVREVIRMRPFTPVPESKDFVAGVISLHGKVIPLVNLRKKFGLGQEPDKQNRILIAQLSDHSLGVIVDKVVDVVPLAEEDISPPDEILKEARYLNGVTRVGENLVLFIDLEKLLSPEEKSDIAGVQGRVEVRKRN